MRKQLACRFTVTHCRRLILQLRLQPRLIYMQYDEIALPAIKPVSSVDHLRERRAVNKSFISQAARGVSPARDREDPFTPLDDMADHCFAGASWCTGIRTSARFRSYARSKNSTSAGALATIVTFSSSLIEAPSPSARAVPLTVTAPRATWIHPWRPFLRLVATV